jgi:molybdate transport system substrate-binding protein
VKDLAPREPDPHVVLCAPTCPAGTRPDAARSAGVTATPTARQNVTAVLTKVKAAEADAGLVYVTDAKATPAWTASRRRRRQGVNKYPIVALKARRTRRRPRRSWFVLSDNGQKILADLGFGGP